MDLASRLNRIKPSSTLAVTAKVLELKAAGKEVIGFAAGEPDFDTWPHVCDAARNAIAAAGYDPTFGARPLKRIIQQRIQNPLATELLKGEFAEGSLVTVDHVDDGFTFESSSPGETLIESEVVG